MSSPTCNHSGSVTPELSRQLVAAVDSMQAFPASVQNILKLTRDMACAPRDLVEVIDKDPVVTVKVLRVVNSAYYSLPKKITSIHHAVVFLGFNTIKNLALSIAAVGMLPANPMAGFDGQRYLLHSLTAAGLARQLSTKFPGADPHDFFIAGLLHDFGKVVVAQVMPMEFRQALDFGLWNETSLHSALLDVAGVDHAAIGAMLLEKWQFPGSLVEAIRHQHCTQPDCPDLAMGILAANLICKRLDIDFGGTPAREEFPAAVAHKLGGTLDQVTESLGDLEAILQEARRFSRI